MRRISFLFRILLNYGSDKKCPFCGSEDTELTGRKYIFLQLRTCKCCELMFRWPKETPGFSEKFYQSAYSEGTYTTELPPPAILQQFIANNFVGSPKDFSQQINVLKGLLPKGRVLDFGCSWGYGVYQLRQAGYDAFGFELSRPRAEHGRRQLGVEILDNLEDLYKLPSQSVDGIFASHVLEHLSSLKETFDLFARILKPDGVIVIMVPNAGGKKARDLGLAWPPFINEKHTLALDRRFFEKNMASYGFKILTLSDPYRISEICHAINNSGRLPAEGEELMVIGQRSSSWRPE